jgi:hypothetical protein
MAPIQQRNGKTGWDTAWWESKMLDSNEFYDSCLLPWKRLLWKNKIQRFFWLIRTKTGSPSLVRKHMFTVIYCWYHSFSWSRMESGHVQRNNILSSKHSNSLHTVI